MFAITLHLWFPKCLAAGGVAIAGCFAAIVGVVATLVVTTVG